MNQVERGEKITKIVWLSYVYDFVPLAVTNILVGLDLIVPRKEAPVTRIVTLRCRPAGLATGLPIPKSPFRFDSIKVVVLESLFYLATLGN